MLSPWDQAWSQSGVLGALGWTDPGPDPSSITYELDGLGQVTAQRQLLVLQKGKCHLPGRVSCEGQSTGPLSGP